MYTIFCFRRRAPNLRLTSLVGDQRTSNLAMLVVQGMARSHGAGEYVRRIAFRSSSVDGISLLGNREIGIGEWIHYPNCAVLLSIG